MPTFVLLTRLSETATAAPRRLEDLEREMMRHLRQECPGVEWINNLAVLGPFDYLDIFRAPDLETAAKVATLVRAYGHAHTEVWGAVEWERYKTLVRDLPDRELITATA
ncbi:MAG TPA: GYD domain-containing protein [Gemmatimonadales bacterium]|nr:GYD domain-containing protein [Gemmatimonadales bacterium]